MLLLPQVMVACSLLDGSTPAPVDPPVDVEYELDVDVSSIAVALRLYSGLSGRQYDLVDDGFPIVSLTFPRKSRAPDHLHRVLERAGIGMTCEAATCSVDLSRCPGGTPLPRWAIDLHYRAQREDRELAVVACRSRKDAVVWGPVAGLEFDDLADQLGPLGVVVATVDETTLVVIPDQI